MTMLHLAVIFLFSALSRALAQCSSHRARVVLSWPDYLRRVAPTALATALDVGLSNWSFLYITVSLYTMTKSSAVLFILIFSLIFKLEELRAALVLVVLLIAGGLFMFTYKSTQFNIEGFALVLGASFIGGIRWTLTQMLLQKAELGLQNPIDTMFHLQPLMFLGLFPLFAVFEGLHLSTSEKIFRFQDTGLLLRVLGSLFLGGILAFGLGFSEFLLVSRTSSLTLSIAGIFKEVCTLLLAAHLLGDQISLLNWLGFALCLSGISLHIALKALHARGTQSPLSEACLLVMLSPWISPLSIPAKRQVALDPPSHLQSSLLSSAAPALAVPLIKEVRLVIRPPPLLQEVVGVISREWAGAWVPRHALLSGWGRQILAGCVMLLSLSPGDGAPKPLKGLGSNPDLELLLRSSQPEDEDNEEEEYFVAQGQQ
uniref:Solute carrier family 35 member C2 n=1 Tax=Bos mutus grunniens TaxID=30521 RepID=A0A8B9YIN0_BOSMU